MNKNTMIYLGAAVLLMFFAACKMTGPEPDPEPEHILVPEGKAAVRIGIDAASIRSRTVLPLAELAGVTNWKLLGSADPEAQTLLTEFSGVTGGIVYLEPGTRNFTLEGYKGTDLILRGNLDNKTITLEGPNNLAFTVAPVWDGTGSIKIIINLPEGHGISTVKVFKDRTELSPELAPDNNRMVFEDSPAAGDYYYSFRLYQGADLYGVVSELIQVRMNLASEKTYTLGREDLNLLYGINYLLNGGQFGGEEIPDSYRRTDKPITLSVPTRPGYEFGGWYGNAGFSGDVLTEIPQDSTGDKSFHAKWTAITYTVEYNANGGSGTTESSIHTYNAAKNLSPNGFTRTGYTFGGWNSRADGTGTSRSEGESVTNLSTVNGEIITLFAQWTAITYNITYHINGGTNGANPADYTIESSITLAAPSRTGYAFGGWYDNDGWSGAAITSIPAGSMGDKIFYARWTPISYTITYNLNGGTNAEANPASYTIENNTITLAAPARTGYTFGGWYDDAAFTGPAVINIPAGSSGNKIFHARWIPSTYTITYNLNGGTNGANPAAYTVAELPVTLAAPSRAGYVFGGWYDNAGLSGAAISSILAGNMGDKEFYAMWTANTYTVEYNANGGSGTTTSSAHTYNDAADLTPNGFTRTGYTFGGWNSEADGSGTNYTDGQSVTNLISVNGGTVTLYAQWTPISYTVAYNANGGSGTTASSSHIYDQAAALTANGFAKDDYIFGGWNTQADGRGTSYTGGQSVTNLSSVNGGTVTLYAQWGIEALINLIVWANEDDNILVSNSDVTISRTGSGNPDSFTATVSSGYTDVQWLLGSFPINGNWGATESITIRAANYAAGTYILGVRASKGGAPYSTDIRFTVTN